MKHFKLMMIALMMCLSSTAFCQEDSSKMTITNYNNFCNHKIRFENNSDFLENMFTYNFSDAKFYRISLIKYNSIFNDTFTIFKIKTYSDNLTFLIEVNKGNDTLYYEFKQGTNNFYYTDTLILNHKYIKRINDSIERIKICEGIELKTDKFSDKKTYKFDDDGGDISFYKIIENGISIYYLSIYSKTSGIYTGTGVNLILSNGSKYSFPTAKVDNSYISSDFYSTCFIKLNINDINTFKKYGIKDYKLYIVEGSSISYDKSIKLFNCLINKK